MYPNGSKGNPPKLTKPPQGSNVGLIDRRWLDFIIARLDRIDKKLSDAASRAGQKSQPRKPKRQANKPFAR